VYYTASGIYFVPDVAMPRARALAQRAEALDPNLAGAHATLGVVLSQYDRDWKASEREFSRAIELDPNSSLAHYYRGMKLLFSDVKLPEALAVLRRAHELDPLAGDVSMMIAYGAYLSGDYAGSVADYRRLTAADPDNATYHWSLAFNYVEQGSFPGAIAEARRAANLTDGALAIPVVAYVYARSGDRAEARRWLDRALVAARSRYVPPYFVAMAYSAIGDQKQALQWLDRAYESHDESLNVVRVDPGFRNLRPEPGYRELLKRLNPEG